jgi:hypothetical protein
MLKILVFLTKREGIETQAFIEHYENNHVPLICDLAPVPIVYKRNFLVRGDEFNKEDGAIDFDVVTELVFPDPPISPGRPSSPNQPRASRSSRTS